MVARGATSAACGSSGATYQSPQATDYVEHRDNNDEEYNDCLQIHGNTYYLYNE